MLQRIIGTYEGKTKGPLLFCLGGMHGNEPAGIEAMEILFKMIEVEPLTNPQFEFAGRFIGLRGNLQAIEKGLRFIEKDLNRQWTHENIARVNQSPIGDLHAEDLELRQLHDIIQQEIQSYQPECIMLLDLHTTSAYGGIFTIATDDPESVRIGVELHAPVIRGMLEGIRGTTLHYFNNDNFEAKTTGVCFESGQHYEPLSINRAIAAIINCMRSIGCVKAEHVENRHDQLLIEFSADLPKVADLVMCHSISANDQFEMEPNYDNFQFVRKGEVLARDKSGPIKAVTDGRVLMPLYQKQGDDGFFLIKGSED